MPYSTWLYNESTQEYMGSTPIVEKSQLEAGYYDLYENEYTGNPIAARIAQKPDALCDFSKGPSSMIMKEIESFWKGDSQYKLLGMTHKRSILLYGPPGCGKTGIISTVIKDIVSKNGIAVQVGNLNKFRIGLSLFRQIQPDTPVVAIMEDIESFATRQELVLLELLDGATSVGGNVLYLSTTNNLDQIPERIRCRPSRVDTLIKIDAPCREHRNEYIDFVLVNTKAEKNYRRDLLDASEGFSLADLKELIVSTFIYKKTVLEAAEILKATKHLVPVEKNDDDDDYDDE